MEKTDNYWIQCFSVQNMNREIMNRILITIIFLIPSIYNYPGGFAMLKMNVCVIERIMKQKQIQADMNNGLITQPILHIDVYSAQTGRMNIVNE